MNTPVFEIYLIMFEDRKDAGQKLGNALYSYKRCDGIILAIPRGGVEVGYYVAKHLELPLSIIVVRKLPFPDNPEAGFGAVAERRSTHTLGLWKRRKRQCGYAQGQRRRQGPKVSARNH